MSTFTDILHTLVDVATGRRNLSTVEADALHAALDEHTEPRPETTTPQVEAAPEAPEPAQPDAPVQAPASPPAAPVPPVPQTPAGY